jgi:RND family efflux transporter MFP subunit
MKNDNIALLEQLRIERQDDHVQAGQGRLWWIAGTLAVLALAAAAALWIWRAAPVRVRVAPVQAQNAAGAAGAAPVLDASGYIVARRQATISAKAAGRLDHLLVAEGQRIKAGQLIASLDDSTVRAQLNQALAQLQSMRGAMGMEQVGYAHAQRELERKKTLAAAQFVSPAEVDAAVNALAVAKARVETARANVEVAQRAGDVARLALDDTMVRAPFSGTVTVREAQPGEIVSPISGGGLTRTGIVTVVDMDSLEAEVDVNENFIDRLVARQKVTLTLNAYPGRGIAAHVVAIVPTVDRAKGTVKVRIAMDEHNPLVLPNMGVRAAFLGAARPDAAPSTARAWRVPATAIVANGLDAVVFVFRGGIVERRQVRLAGAPSGGNATIVHGVADGELVVVNEVATLRHGGKAQIVN